MKVCRLIKFLNSIFLVSHKVYHSKFFFSGLNTLSTYLSCQLSFDLQQLESVGYKSTDSPDFVEIVSRSIRYSESKNVYPIFIIPSINAELMKPLIKNLMYPVFCATFIENFCSAFETASQLLEVIKYLLLYHLILYYFVS